MRKRMLQVTAVLGLMGAICASGAIQERVPAQAVAAENEPSAWQAAVMPASGEYLCHEVSDTSRVTILDEVIALGQVTLPEREGWDHAEEEAEPAPVMGAVYSAETPKLVGIDPGHLGYTAEKYKNTGAESVYGTAEYEWTLEIALLLSQELADRGYDVYLLRTTNDQKQFPYNNGQRARAANDMGCDILVAIHWDSNVDEEICGYHTIYKGNRKSPAYRLAEAVSSAYGQAVDGAIERLTGPVARRDLWELNVATMPGIILECGYSSNREDATWLEDKANHESIVRGIADGIDAYFEAEKDY